MKRLFLVFILLFLILSCTSQITNFRLGSTTDTDFEPFPIILDRTTHLFLQPTVIKEFTFSKVETVFTFTFTHLYPADTSFYLRSDVPSLYITTNDTTYAYAHAGWVIDYQKESCLERATYSNIPIEDLEDMASADEVKILIVGRGYNLYVAGEIVGLQAYLINNFTF